jgi:hypothetical protein
VTGARSHPWDFAQAVRNANAQRSAQAAAEEFFKTCSRDYAKAEEAYRLALASEIVRQHDAGVAWSVAPDLARGDKRVADLRRKRDIAEGMKDAALQALWRAAADRRDAGRFIEWSMRVDVAVHAQGREEESEPDVEIIYGTGRRAAA